MASKEKKPSAKRDDTGKSEIAQRLKRHPFLFIGTVVVLVVVIVTFVFGSALGGGVQSGGDFTFGYYNNVPVRYVPNNYFYQVLQSLTQQYQLAQDDPNYVSMTTAIWQRAFEETVVRMGILDEMKEAGYAAPEEVVDREVAEHPLFRDDNGRFSTARYRALDEESRTLLWRQSRDDLIANYYRSDLEGLRTASKEASFISAMASPLRTFYAAVFPLDSYPDSELLSYAAANEGLFKATHLSKITVTSSEREARQIFDAVKNGTTPFEEAAQTNSQDSYAERSGDMGIRPAYELIPEIGNDAAWETLVNLKRGDLSDLVQVPAGWAFFRAEEDARSADMGDPLELGKVRSYVTENQRGMVEDWLMAEAEKFSALAKETGFDGAVAAGNVQRREFGPIPLNYGDSPLFSTVTSTGVNELLNASENQFFWEAAFSTPLLTLSAPVVIDNNVIVLYPREESSAETDAAEQIEAYLSFLTGSAREQSLRPYFLNNEKFDNRFTEVFAGLWGAN